MKLYFNISWLIHRERISSSDVIFSKVCPHSLKPRKQFDAAIDVTLCPIIMHRDVLAVLKTTDGVHVVRRPT